MSKEACQKQLLWYTRCRNYIILPCIVVSSAVCLYDINTNNQKEAYLNLFFAAWNVVLYMVNVWLCGLYSRFVEAYEKLDK